MPETFRDTNIHSANGAAPRDPASLPRGIVPPPPELVARVAADRARFPPEIYDDTYAKLTLDDWTLDWYYAGLDIAFRSVPQGIEVLAIGEDEIGEYLNGKSQDELLTFEIAHP